RRKDEFLAVLAHELRNPLAPILNAAELLRRLGGEHPQILHARDMIERQAQQLSKLVDDLLDIARITRNMVKLNTDKVQLERVVTDAVDASRPLIESKLHELTLELCDEQLIVVGDHARLTQVVTNLLNNAAKYTDPGGHIRVVLERGQGEALIRVIDDGVGMTPELIGRAFDAFSHPEHAFDRAQGGLGIGLTLVRRLIELHGGSVVAASAGS